MVASTSADITYMGGEAGGGKSYAAICLAATQHQVSVIFRRELADLRGGEGLLETSKKILSRYGSYNGNEHVWRVNVNGKARYIELAGCQREDDKHAQQGRARDLYVFDEVTQFSRTQVQYITGWNRSSDPNQRCRVLLLGNPPTSAEGEWVIQMFAAWLDPAHPNRAKPGEIRWYVTVGEDDLEVASGSPMTIAGEVRYPRSRTFIPSKLAENPTYANGSYAQVLDGLPEPLRSQLKNGDFSIGRRDDIWQVIPTGWVKTAMLRWRPDGHDGRPQDQVGQDVAHGGADNTVLVERRGTWLGMPQVHPGAATPSGHDAALLLEAILQPTGFGAIDGTGVGASCYDIARGKGLDVYAVMFGAGSDRRDLSGKLAMRNVRAAMHWYMRELLDPANGHGIALPPHPHMLGDLTAPHWSPTPGGVLVEDKADVKKRLGRSPDVGEATLLAACPWLRVRPTSTGTLRTFARPERRLGVLG